MHSPCEMIERFNGKSFVASFFFLAFLLSGCGGPRTILGNVPQLSSLNVASGTSTLALGQSAQATATGIFSDGSHKDETAAAVWTSSAPEVATISASGLITSHSIGRAVMTASLNHMIGKATLSVTTAAITSLAISPDTLSIALGTNASLKVTGTYTNKDTQDVTPSMKWALSDPTIASISPEGLATAKGIGVTTITASLGSSKVSCQLAVLPAALVSLAVNSSFPSFPLGTSTQLKVQGTYSDGSVRDMTSSASWSSSPAGILAIDSSGVVTGQKTGAATVAATVVSIQGKCSLSVSPAQLLTIQILADKTEMPLGTSQFLSAKGAYTDQSTKDLTNSVVWSSYPESSVVIADTGQAMAKAVGSATIVASLAGIRGSVGLTVSQASLVSITISPSGPVVPLSDQVQLSVLGSFTDGSKDVTSEVSWTVNDPTIAAVDSGGNVLGLKVGSTDATALVGTIVGTTTITVEPVALVNYFSSASANVDTTIRISNPGSEGDNSCSMLYVFDQDQQMAECCGCQISRNGLRTLSLQSDLLGNPLTRVGPVAGSLMVVTAESQSNSACDAASLIPSGEGVAWATHLQTVVRGQFAISETAFSRTPLTATLSSALQEQCQFIQLLGSGQGICQCGKGN